MGIIQLYKIIIMALAEAVAVATVAVAVMVAHESNQMKHMLKVMVNISFSSFSFHFSTILFASPFHFESGAYIFVKLNISHRSHLKSDVENSI